MNVNYLYIKIKVISYNSGLLYDCIEINNKFIGERKEDMRDMETNKINVNNNRNYQRKFLSNGVIVFLIVLFAIILLFLFIRWIKRKNAINVTNYFNQDFPILK